MSYALMMHGRSVHEGRETSREMALRSFRSYVEKFTGVSKELIPSFCRDCPAEAETLAALLDVRNPGLNHVIARMLTRQATKVRWAVEAERSRGDRCGHSRVRSRCSRLVVALATVTFALPVLLCPTHPIAVYAYLLESSIPAIIAPAYARSSSGLAEFLISPTQITQYRKDLPADMLDGRSGHMFAIVQWSDGPLTQAPIRTWNSFLPATTPDILTRWLDRKELPYLGDEVDLWLRGATIKARGHYHAFGGGPSPGDGMAQTLLELPEIVVSNGLVPTVYLRGQLVPYGKDVDVTEEVYRQMRTLVRGIMMEVRDMPLIMDEPGPGLTSFLAYLSDYREVDITDHDAIAREILQLCDAFKSDHGAAFTSGFTANSYATDWDRFSVLRNLESVNSWAEFQLHGYWKLDQTHDDRDISRNCPDCNSGDPNLFSTLPKSEPVSSSGSKMA